MSAFAKLHEKMKKHFDKGHYDEALKVLQGMPKDMKLSEADKGHYYEALGMCYVMQGDMATGLPYLKQALAHPDGLAEETKRRITSNYVMYSHYLPDISDEELRDAHFSYAKHFSDIKPFVHGKKDKQKLRIGYISTNVYDHIVTNFSVQLFAGHDRSRFETVLYDVGDRMHNEVTQWLAGMVMLYRDLSKLSDAEAAKQIYDDDIDILFDLTGHSEGGKTLRIMAYRPAPVQVSGIGYTDTTGLPAIDYFLTDVYCDPPGNEELFSEKLIRLPHSHFCWTPSEAVLKCHRSYSVHDPIIFGSFNNYNKITDEMLSIWHRVIEAVPGSRLLLKDVLDDARKRELLRARAEKLGFTAKQLELRPGSPDYLDEYVDIDIALDTYPYPGGGTTCEALYMGVPVVTRYGRRHGSRFGLSLLSNIGIEELAADTPENYIARAVMLARDKELLSAMHGQLRRMMQNSPLMRAKDYVREVEAAYETIWKEWLGK